MSQTVSIGTCKEVSTAEALVVGLSEHMLLCAMWHSSLPQTLQCNDTVAVMKPCCFCGPDVVIPAYQLINSSLVTSCVTAHFQLCAENWNTRRDTADDLTVILLLWKSNEHHFLEDDEKHALAWLVLCVSSAS